MNFIPIYKIPLYYFFYFLLDPNQIIVRNCMVVKTKSFLKYFELKGRFKLQVFLLSAERIHLNEKKQKFRFS